MLDTSHCDMYIFTFDFFPQKSNVDGMLMMISTHFAAQKVVLQSGAKMSTPRVSAQFCLGLYGVILLSDF